jgi:hypothetical protein
MGPIVIRPRSRGVRSFFADTLLLSRRNLVLTLRTPELVVFAAVTPVMFVLLFRYVFGGSIHVPGYDSYVDYLIPGIVVQTALFGGSSSAVAVAEDLSKGVTDRLRSLPTNRAAILAARTFADLIRLSYTMGLLIVIGLLVGFRPHNSPLPILAGIGIALLFGYACSWLFTLLGLMVRDADHLPARVRRVDVHVHAVHARGAARVRQCPAGDTGRERAAPADPWPRLRGSRPALRGRLVTRHPDRLGPARELEVPQDLNAEARSAGAGDRHVGPGATRTGGPAVIPFTGPGVGGPQDR